MNITIALTSSIPLALAVIFYFKKKSQERMLNDGDPFDGTLVEYKRLGKRLYPIIVFTDNGENITLRQSGITNWKLIKDGSKVRVVSIGNGKYITDYNVKLSGYYAITTLLAGLFILGISFYI